MNKETENTGKGTQPAARPTILIAVSVCVAAAIGGVIYFKHKSPPTGSQAQPPATAIASKNSSEFTAETTPGTAVSQPLSKPAATDKAVPTEPSPAQAASDAKQKVKDLVSALNDTSKPIKDRKQAMKALAQIASAEALAALKTALQSGPDDLRAAIAESLGECTTAECTATLLGLLNDPNQAVVEAAIKGLAQQGSPQAVEALTKLLYDSSRSSALRGEVAAALGTVSQPGIVDTLSQAAANISDPEIVTQIVNALGGRDFAETQAFFQTYLRNPNISSELRVEAVEALSHAQGDPSAFLATIASDVDSDVRVAAAWAMSATETSGNAGAQLLSLLQSEQDPDVRLRLYQALRNQESFDPGLALATVQKETDPSARVAGLGMLAKNLRDNPTPELQSFFDQTAAQELKQMALSGEDPHDRMAAVIALTRAATTPSAQAALVEVAQQSNDPKVKQSAGNIVSGLQGRVRQ